MDYNGDYAPEHFEVIESIGVGGGIIWHEEPKENKDQILESKGKPVNVSPIGELSNDAREDSIEKY